MEDKLFDLMSKFYSDFSEFRKETSSRLDNVEGQLTTLNNKM